MSFKALNWNPSEQVGEAKMDIMNDNARWLYQNTPRAIYTLPGGLRRVEGIKIASGRIIINKQNSDSATAEVRFGNFFTSRCEPHIITGVVSSGQTRIFSAVTGIGRLIPSANGFRASVNVAAGQAKNDKITNTIYVTWTAQGY